MPKDPALEMLAGYIRAHMEENNMEDTHENRVAATRFILDDLVKEGIISSWSWDLNGRIWMNLRKH